MRTGLPSERVCLFLCVKSNHRVVQLRITGRNLSHKINENYVDKSIEHRIRSFAM